MISFGEDLPILVGTELPETPDLAEPVIPETSGPLFDIGNPDNNAKPPKLSKHYAKLTSFVIPGNAIEKVFMALWQLDSLGSLDCELKFSVKNQFKLKFTIVVNSVTTHVVVRHFEGGIVEFERTQGCTVDFGNFLRESLMPVIEGNSAPQRFPGRLPLD